MLDLVLGKATIVMREGLPVLAVAVTANGLEGGADKRQESVALGESSPTKACGRPLAPDASGEACV
ncbi:hypothetical protein LQ948_05385 [Jiella sp. MQZ9-1]|uniref:Uncharacterized protein n=1 Tax=Jiella flava TaxID=2816857 RepID=A0A939FWA9_9HYPH|nr:hypothetical protein [Jiella flava]MBO0662034.1 hypothetical protein [Jiella flava]MCD2470639.1 hypothetical protein [Jiella flava]